MIIDTICGVGGEGFGLETDTGAGMEMNVADREVRIQESVPGHHATPTCRAASIVICD